MKLIFSFLFLLQVSFLDHVLGYHPHDHDGNKIRKRNNRNRCPRGKRISIRDRGVKLEEGDYNGGKQIISFKINKSHFLQKIDKKKNFTWVDDDGWTMLFKLKDSPNFSLNNFDSEYSLDNFKIHPLNSNNLKLFPTKNSFAVSNTDYNRKLLNQGTQSHFAELFFNKDQSSYFLFFDFFGSLVPKIEDYEIDFQEVVIFNAASVKKRCLLRGEEDRKGALEFGSDFEWRQISRRQKKEVVEEGDEDEENVEELENVETADELDRTLWDPED